MQARSRHHRQRGVAAIEFAIIFVVLFAIFYALVSYTFPLLFLQAMNYASAQAARAALQVDPASTNYSTKVTAKVNSVLNDQLDVLPNILKQKIVKNTQVDTGTGVITVTLTYPYEANPPVPVLTLPVIGDVPKVPPNLVAIAKIAP